MKSLFGLAHTSYFILDLTDGDHVVHERAQENWAVKAVLFVEELSGERMAGLEELGGAVSERERETERQTGRQTDRHLQTDRQR